MMIQPVLDATLEVLTVVKDNRNERRHDRPQFDDKKGDDSISRRIRTAESFNDLKSKYCSIFYTVFDTLCALPGISILE